MPTTTSKKPRQQSARAASVTIDLQRDSLLNTSQVAELTGYHEKTIRNMLCRREGPKAIKLGTKAQSRVVYRRSDVEAWIMNRGRTVNG
jgi:predicted DNA-binding transcriptional regulator AlpA